MQSSHLSKFIPTIIVYVKYNIPTLVCIQENVNVPNVERNFEVDLEILGSPYYRVQCLTY